MAWSVMGSMDGGRTAKTQESEIAIDPSSSNFDVIH
jgi:hypothetical protein